MLYGVFVIFYSAIALLLGLSLCLLAYLLLRKPKATENYALQRIHRFIALHQKRLDDLEQELAKQYISTEEYSSLVAEQSRSLIKQVTECESVTSYPRSNKPFLWLVIPVPFLVMLIYMQLGAYQDWNITEHIQQLNHAKSEQDYQQQLGLIYELVEQRIHQRPDQIEYRLMLARESMSKNDYEKAVGHYAILVELLPDDADASAFYAQALYLQANRQMTAAAALYLDKSLAQNSNQTTALGLLGIASFEQGEWAEAIRVWKKLIAILPSDSQQRQMIQRGIMEAEDRLSAAKKTDSTQVGVVSSPEKGIDIRLGRAEAFATLPPDTTVFIYALASEGPPMPLAAKKLELKDLPLDITLTQAMAMMPQMSLASFSMVKVGARVSLTGKPSAETGDWQTESEVFDWQKNTQIIDLRIWNQLP